MIQQARDKVKKHIKTHSEHSVEERAAISLLGTFLNPGGRINTSFAANDTWPNHDGTFEFISNPDVSRRPKQNFFVQIKGTSVYTEKDGIIKYSLKSLAFPAYICDNVSFDPGILFVVLDPDQRGSQRVFWKYMSVDFINSINFDQDSMTIAFSANEEILNTDESVAAFCEKLEMIIDQHSFINQLDSRNYTRRDVEGIIAVCDTEITESIERLDIFNDTRDGVSRRILRRLDDLCSAALLLNAIDAGIDTPTLPLAWERSLLNIETKYLGTFLKGLQYIGKRIPDEGQSERLMLKYYEFLWQIRKSLKEKYEIDILSNLEKFPLHIDQIDRQYYELAAMAVEAVCSVRCDLCASRYYVQKKTPFFIGRERYYEITLQLAGAYASKYNRITTYTKENISTGYSIQVGYVESAIDLWGISSRIKVITDWRVSVDPVCLNKLGKVLKMPTRISSQYGEYKELMSFLTHTGLNFLDLIDFQEVEFLKIIDAIYRDIHTPVYRDVLLTLREQYSKASDKFGRNVVRYLLLNLREETLENVMPTQFTRYMLCDELNLSSSCKPFEKNPFISNLAGSKTSVSGQIRSLISVVGSEKIDVVRPYLSIKNATKQTGEIYFEITSDAKDIIKTPGANVELLSTWRTQDQALISLWNEVRTRADMITEKLVINGPYSEDIGPNVFKRECEDEVILCLNYDGKFGLNNMNNYFQAANTKGEAIPWAEWSYKVGDPILFNDSKRFDLLYNNLKGRIVDIEKHSGSISFTVDVEIPLTELMCKRDGIEFIESIENGTRIRFAVYEYDESKKGEDLDENLRLKSVVPFQLAYAVSIHKAQGLEYDSVKVIIPSNNAEKITHGIFYTAITRAKTNLKIYWSSETMHDVVKGFATDESKRKSLEIVKTKLGKN